MASLKTVRYSFPALASLVNNTLTNLTQITVNLSESGTKTFRKVVAVVTCDDIVTATGGTLTTKTFSLRLGAAAYTTVANANALTNSGENHSFLFAVDFTSHFTANWSGTSMTCDFQATINQSTGTTLNMVNVCVTLEITYEYDETSTTQTKTVAIPLNAPVSNITTTLTTYDTIPNLSTRLGESTKTFRNIYIEIIGNEARNAATTDHTMTVGVNGTNVTTGNMEGALASDRNFRYISNVTATINTGATQTFQLSTTVARCNHVQAILWVTYDYDNDASTVIENSVILPAMGISMGGTTSADYHRMGATLNVQEPATITSREIAFFAHWTQTAALSGLNMRVGTGSFVTYTDTASVLCGSNVAMIRNDAGFTVARGINTFTVDAYRTSESHPAWGFNGYFIVNYTSGKASGGSHLHNKSIRWNLAVNGTAAYATNYTIAATAPVIPEADYYLSSVGLRNVMFPSAGTLPNSCAVEVERLSAEGGVSWETGQIVPVISDAEAGSFYFHNEIKEFFKRFPTEPQTNKVDIETSRRWKLYPAAVAVVPSLDLMFTYHGINYDVTRAITSSGGGTVNVDVFNSVTGELVAETSRTGDGNFTFTAYDDTATYYAVGYEDATHRHVSETFSVP